MFINAWASSKPRKGARGEKCPLAVSRDWISSLVLIPVFIILLLFSPLFSNKLL